MAAAHLGALREEAAVLPLDDQPRLQRPREARPAGAGVVLVARGEERLARDDVHVDPLAVVVVVLVPEGRLRALLLRHLELQRGEPLLEFLLRGLDERVPGGGARGRVDVGGAAILPPGLVEELVAPRAPAVVFVADRVFPVVVLVVVLGGPELPGRQDLGDQRLGEAPRSPRASPSTPRPAASVRRWRRRSRPGTGSPGRRTARRRRSGPPAARRCREACRSRPSRGRSGPAPPRRARSCPPRPPGTSGSPCVPPVYPEITALTPSSFSNGDSMHQKQPPAKTAVSSRGADPAPTIPVFTVLTLPSPGPSGQRRFPGSRRRPRLRRRGGGCRRSSAPGCPCRRGR